MQLNKLIAASTLSFIVDDKRETVELDTVTLSEKRSVSDLTCDVYDITAQKLPVNVHEIWAVVVRATGRVAHLTALVREPTYFHRLPLRYPTLR